MSLVGCGYLPSVSTPVTRSTPAPAATSGASEPSATTAPPPATTAPATPSNTSTARTGVGAGHGTGPLYDVVGIADGDTIRVRIDGVKESIRIIGLDTPETKKPKTPVQCFGKEASSNMQSLVQSRQVQLEADTSQGERDRYGRLLRHVFVGGSTNVALAQIEAGFGREYTYDGPYAHRLAYLAAQQRAKSARIGTWGPPCNGFHKTGGVTIGP